MRDPNTVIRLIAQMHRLGVSTRAIARVFGMSKSTLHRQLPAILLLAAEEAPCVPLGTPSSAAAVETAPYADLPVPYGTSIAAGAARRS
jgi:transposase-like protein